MNPHPYYRNFQNYPQYPYPFQQQPYNHNMSQMYSGPLQHGVQQPPPEYYTHVTGRPDQFNQTGYTNPFFENPLQQEEYNPYQMKAWQQQQQQTYANPYPKASFMAKPAKSGMGNIMNSFKSQDGSFDFNKVMNTAGQMMGAVNQVSSLVKGLGGVFKL
ncbi:YppG family protein [Rossellomorea aquimaris]|uniref:YppG family protein n=1 Tax=Rossellomorea aquimaris TaxID=189382 RepID=UPI001CD485EF|nr:YppG family protein [Rossellomorea aquimaris]MCA1054596.1 YppG family protein [Rossellomorea aquimaris]